MLSNHPEVKQYWLSAQAVEVLEFLIPVNELIFYISIDSFQIPYVISINKIDTHDSVLWI
jgi:hypothetical protein